MTDWKIAKVLAVAAAFCIACAMAVDAKARAPFPDTLVLSFDKGPHQASLERPFRYVDAQGVTWSVPRGYVTNGASIPRVLWSIVGAPFSGAYREAAVIHDFLCDSQVATSSKVHLIFKKAMLDSGVPKFQAEFMYQSVVAFGPKWPGFTGEQREMTDQDVKRLIKEVCGGKSGGGCEELKALGR